MEVQEGETGLEQRLASPALLQRPEWITTMRQHGPLRVEDPANRLGPGTLCEFEPERYGIEEVASHLRATAFLRSPVRRDPGEKIGLPAQDAHHLQVCSERDRLQRYGQRARNSPQSFVHLIVEVQLYLLDSLAGGRHLTLCDVRQSDRRGIAELICPVLLRLF